MALLASALVIANLPAAAQGGPTEKETAPSAAKQAIALRDQALGALAEGDLDLARKSAAEAVSIDGSNLTLRAREVMFEVALAQGKLTEAAAELQQYKGLPNLPPTAGAWLERANLRLQAERADGWADAGSVRSAAERLQGRADLELADQRWLDRAAWRLEVRTAEQARDLPSVAKALEAAAERPGLSDEDQRWLAVSAARASVLTAEYACEYDRAQGALTHLRQLPAAREGDLAWAKLARLRIEARVLDAAGADADANAKLNLISALPGLPEPEKRWVDGYRTRLKLEAAMRGRDEARIAALRPDYEAWAAWEPGCAWLKAGAKPDPGRVARPNPGPWVHGGLLIGSEGWSVQADNATTLTDLSLLQGPVLGWSAGGTLGAAWPVFGPVGLRGDLRVAPTFLAWYGEDSVNGALGLDTALSAVWMRSLWELSLGARATNLRLSAAGDSTSATGWDYGVAPQLGFALQGSIGPGFARLDLAGAGLPDIFMASTTASYSLGGAAVRPTLGLDGRLAGGVRTGDLDDASFVQNHLDWSAAISVGATWRKSW